MGLTILPAMFGKLLNPLDLGSLTAKAGLNFFPIGNLCFNLGNPTARAGSSFFVIGNLFFN